MIPPSASSGAHQLRLFILTDLGFTASAAVAVALLATVLPPSPAYPIVIGLPVGAALMMRQGLVLLARGDVPAAVRWVSTANWAIAVGASWVVTFLWPLMLLVAVLPCFLAVSFLRGRAVRVYLAISLAVALSTVMLGLLQDFSGFSADAPSAVRNTLLIVVTPVIAALIGVLSLSNNERLQRALAEAIRAQRALAEQAEQLRLSRARVVVAGDRERRRIERDLHDGAQQRLVAIKLHLSQAAAVCTSDPTAAAATLGRLVQEVSAAHREVRELAQGVYPPVLAEHGLGQALRAVADRCPSPVRLDFREPIGRHAPAIEAAVYFCCAEGVLNAVKHGGSTVTIVLGVGVADGELWFRVADDGQGFDPSHAVHGTGLQNLADRLGAVGGTLDVTAGPGRGVTLEGRLPRSGGDPRVVEGLTNDRAR